MPVTTDYRERDNVFTGKILKVTVDVKPIGAAVKAIHWTNEASGGGFLPRRMKREISCCVSPYPTAGTQPIIECSGIRYRRDTFENRLMKDRAKREQQR
jgi:hypothetical protein